MGRGAKFLVVKDALGKSSEEHDLGDLAPARSEQSYISSRPSVFSIEIK